VLASGLLGKCWRPRTVTDPPEPQFATTLIEYTTVAKQSDALALLHVMRTLAPEQRDRDLAAERISGRNGRPPAWTKTLDAVTVGECWRYQDVLGDTVSVLCPFERGGARHALIVQTMFDQQWLGWAKEIHLVDDPDALLAGVRERVAASGGVLELAAIAPARARALIEDGIAGSTVTPGLAVDESFARYRALALARCRALPGPRRAPALPVRRRAALVTEFFDANGIERTEAATRCARLIVDYGCDADNGDPLRISPVKVARMTARLDRDLDADQRKLLPVVLDAYLPWAGAKRGVPPRLLGDAVARGRRLAALN
jgi:hypothetical protein